MARKSAQIFTSIWNLRGDFRNLSEGAQRLYLLILTQPGLSHCGVLSLTPAGGALFSPTSTPEGIADALNELETERYIAVDVTTSEVMVRTFFKHDGLLRIPNMVRAMARDFDCIQSDDLQQQVAEALPQGFGETFGAGFEADFPPAIRQRFRQGNDQPLILGNEEPQAFGCGDRGLGSGVGVDLDLGVRGCGGKGSDFESFWAVYPRHVGKQDARRSWDTAVKHAKPKVILAAATRFANDPNLPLDKNFIPHPSTWLNQGRWEDEPLPPRPEDRPNRSGPNRGTDAMLALHKRYSEEAAAE